MPTKNEPALFTTAEVAEIAGITRSYAPSWCARHGISRDWRASNRPYLYPAAAVRAAHQRDTRRRKTPADLRLRRWVAKALIA